MEEETLARPGSWRVRLVACVGAIAGLVLTPVLANAQAQKVKIGTVPAYELNGPVWAAVHKGYFQQEGIDPQIIYLGGPRTRDALASGDVDVALISVAVGAIARQAGLPFKLIGLWYNAESFAVMVRSDLVGKVKKISDLKGIRVIPPQAGAAAWAVGMAVLQKGGLDYRSDVKVIHITDYAPPVWINLFERKDAEAGVVWQPIQNVLVTRGIAQPLLDLRMPGASMEWFGGEVASMAMFTTEKQISEKKGVLAKIVQATRKGHDFVTGASDEEVAKLLAPDMKLDAENALKVVSSIRPGYGKEFGISVSRLENDLKVFRGTGLLKRDIPVSQFADFQFAGRLP